MRIYSFLVLLMCLAFPLHAAETKDVFVSLRPAVEVQAKTIRMGDVATVTVRDSAEQAKWLAIEIARPASFATPIRLSRADISRQVDAAHPELQGRLVWGGSNEVVVSGKLQRVELETGVSSAAAFLVEQLADGGLVSLRLLDGAGPLEVPLGHVRIRPDTHMARRIGAYAEIPLIVEVDGVQAARPLLRFSVSKSQRNLVPEASVQSAAPLPVVEQSKNSGGDVANAGPFIVNRQQPVTIVIDGDGVRIESEGIALANARQGDKVRVRRTNGNIELAGRAVQQGVVLVEEN